MKSLKFLFHRRRAGHDAEAYYDQDARSVHIVLRRLIPPYATNRVRFKAAPKQAAHAASQAIDERIDGKLKKQPKGRGGTKARRLQGR